VAVKNPKTPQANPSSGKRPYAQDQGGYVQKIRRVTDRGREYMLREFELFMKHSEMKKPYMSPTYDDMEYGTVPWNTPTPNPDVPKTPSPPEPPGPIPPSPPGPRPGPTDPVYPPPPGWDCRGCWGPPSFEYCPGGACVSFPLNPVCPGDPIVSASVHMGGGTISVTPNTGSYCPGAGSGFVFIELRTRSGVTCFAEGTSKNPNLCLTCGTPSIGYTTTQMAINETQQLSVVGGGVGPYSWSVMSGGGSISGSGLYTAPSSNANCSGNPTIGLICKGATMATLSLAINGTSGTAGYGAYCSKTSAGGYYCPDGHGGLMCQAAIMERHLNCNGTVSGSTSGCTNPSVQALGCPPDYCANVWPTLCAAVVANCTPGFCTDGCSPYGEAFATPVFHDTRTVAQKAAGCCPSQLM